MADEPRPDTLEMEDMFSGEDGVEHPLMREAFRALEAKYRKFFEASHEMRFAVNRAGRLLEVNQAGVEIFGYLSKEELLEIPSMSCLYADPGDRDRLQQKIEEDGFVQDYEIKMKRKDGSAFVSSVTACLWSEEDGTVCWEGLLQDITERKRWKEALRKAERQNKEISLSEKQIRSLNQHILNMLMVMSHDIRGPLVSIAATLKLLIRGTYGNMDKSVYHTLQDLMARVAQLIGIAEDCLGKANSVEGAMRMDREMLDLRQDIIDPVLDELSNDIQRNGIMIDNRLGAIPAGTIPVHVNKMWLKAVFRNLFKNAIKYGDRGCTIAFGFEDHDSHYRINVYNSGSNIPEEHRDKLFTRFGRIETSGNEKREGVGLGLFLIKEIIRRHGGDIWYQAKPDGSDFIFTIAKEKGMA